MSAEYCRRLLSTTSDGPEGHATWLTLAEYRKSMGWKPMPHLAEYRKTMGEPPMPRRAPMEETSPDSSDSAPGAAAPKLQYALAGGGPPREIALFADLAEARIAAMVMDGMGLRTKAEE